MEVISIPLSELDPMKFMFSEKKTKSWNFKNKKTGKQQSGSKTYVELYYEKPGQKLCFVINDVKSFNGIQSTDNFKRGFMSINLKEDKLKEIEKYFDTPVFNLAFQNRKELLKNARNVTQPAEMRVLYHGIVTPGKEKKDSPGEKWDDQLTCSVNMKKKGQQPVVDENSCVIEDLEGRPYAWSTLDGKPLKEVAIEVDQVVFGDNIKVQGTYRLIVPEGQEAPKVTTKRRMEQQKKRPHSDVESGSGDDHKANPPALENVSAPPVAAATAPVASDVKEPASKKPRVA
jgi:hypothetical protein